MVALQMWNSGLTFIFPEKNNAMADFDWSTFSVAINIKAAPEKLYKAWATRRGMEEWFLRISEFSRPDGTVLKTDERVKQGDKYKWMWHGWPDETVELGKIIEANGVDFLKFSFGNAGICSVSIQPHKEECIVRLKQEEIPDTEEGRQNWHLGCKTGWTFYMANMKSILEGGIDLRNKELSTMELLNK
jgi:uncharacterized protein YndB with AHSA1/START domain